ncbi:hypothetical protein N7512_006377 [Penicillium capsulatum]|nr:hypothetical protein N7512_006377 [Penicillium capsulatum]
MAHHIHRLLQRDMLHGHPSSFISGLMHSAYISCQNEFGKGSDRRRKTIIRTQLQDSRFFPKHAHVTRVEYNKVLSECFDTLQGRVNQEIESLIRDFHSVVAGEGQIHEAQQAPELARALGERVERTEGALNKTYRVLKELRN